MKDTFLHSGNEADQSQPTDRPMTLNKTGEVAGKVTIHSPDLTKKDAGKWMTAWQMASNVWYPDVSMLFDFYTYVLGIDNTLGGLVEDLQTAVMNKRLLYKNSAGEEVPELKKLIASKQFRELIKELIDARLWGRGAVEFVVGKEFRWKQVPRKHVKTKWQVISYEQNGAEGYDYTKLWNVWVIDNGDLGDLLSCALASAYKKDAVADWAELIEGFGQPTQIIWYELFNDQVQKELDYILENAGSARRIKLPKGTEYKQEQNLGNGTGDLQALFIDLMNKEIAKRMVGGTETTGTSKGSGHAQAAIHYKVQLERVKVLMDYITDLLNEPQFIRVLQSYGFSVGDGAFEFDKEVDIEYITKYSPVLKTAKELGLPIGKKFVYETLAIPEPKDGEEVIEWIQAEVVHDEEYSPQQPPRKPGAKKKKQPPQDLNDTLLNRARRIRNFFAWAQRKLGV